ncbi:MAG TPA: hemerythrin domain-containing protein [Gallionellaceae bacterium]
MKRSPLLQPLSREHHTALSLANACQRAAESGDTTLIDQACQRGLQLYANELDAHFNTEEQTLLPLLQTTETQPLAQRTLLEHRQLRDLLDGLRQSNAESLKEFGQLLKEHVRFEERELFPALEVTLHARNQAEP